MRKCKRIDSTTPKLYWLNNWKIVQKRSIQWYLLMIHCWHCKTTAFCSKKVVTSATAKKYLSWRNPPVDLKNHDRFENSNIEGTFRYNNSLDKQLINLNFNPRSHVLEISVGKLSTSSNSATVNRAWTAQYSAAYIAENTHRTEWLLCLKICTLTYYKV